jgi:hypothetical protein
LTVRSNIHPISAPTGTDDDMGGNDKAGALGGLIWERDGETEASAQLLLKPGQFDRYWPFMTSPGPECTCRELEKPQVWPKSDSCARQRTGRVTEAPDLHSAGARISLANNRIPVPFYIFTILPGASGADQAGNAPHAVRI